MSSLRRGHANLLCIVPILSYETVFTPLVHTRGMLDPDIERIALVAQWIEHQTSNLGVAGSSPATVISFWALGV